MSVPAGSTPKLLLASAALPPPVRPSPNAIGELNDVTVPPLKLPVTFPVTLPSMFATSVPVETVIFICYVKQICR